MEITVKHTVDFSPATLNTLVGILGSINAGVKSTPTAKTAEVTEAKAETKAPTAGATTLKDKAAAKEKVADTDFSDLDAEAQLEAIRTEVTKHTKKGKTADIKLLLAHFDAAKAGDLDTTHYNTVYDILKRYGAVKDGEMKDFLPEADDLA